VKTQKRNPRNYDSHQRRGQVNFNHGAVKKGKMKNKAILSIVCSFLILAFCSVAQGASENGEFDSLRSVLEKWVEAKQLISSEKQNWKARKEILVDRSRLLEGQVKDLEEKIAAANADIEKTEEKRDSLSVEHKKMDAAISLLEDSIAKLEKRTLDLLVRLPEPVQEQVAPLSQEIPDTADQTALPLSTRYQNLIGVLNYINKFNNAITLTTEVRTLDNSQAVEVKVIYIGLGQAYFSNDAATIGGVGVPTDDGWKWERRDEIASEVSSAIAMYNSEQTADYVALPVDIQN
jgi:septal ring factor EnvC (AmiA/AmiB activator)